MALVGEALISSGLTTEMNIKRECVGSSRKSDCKQTTRHN
jgi:hypothetical protein